MERIRKCSKTIIHDVGNQRRISLDSREKWQNTHFTRIKFQLILFWGAFSGLVFLVLFLDFLEKKERKRYVICSF
jgi:hypothetical protein